MDRANIASRNSRVLNQRALEKSIRILGIDTDDLSDYEAAFAEMQTEAEESDSKITLTLYNASDAAITTANFQLDGSGTDFQYQGETVTPNSSGVAVIPVPIKTAEADYECLILDGSDNTLGEVNLPMTGDHETMTLQTVTFTCTDGSSDVDDVTIALSGDDATTYYAGDDLETGASNHTVTTMLPAGTYNYTASATEYDDTTGTITITDAAVAETVTMVAE